MSMVETVARAIWNRLREDEDRCDMELEDMGGRHPVWDYARAAIAAMQGEPVAWMYERKAECWPPAPSVITGARWDKNENTRPFWTETPLYALPLAPDADHAN